MGIKIELRIFFINLIEINGIKKQFPDIHFFNTHVKVIVIKKISLMNFKIYFFQMFTRLIAILI